MSGLPKNPIASAGERALAPGALGLVQAFVNSLDIEAARDDLRSPADLRTWLAQRGLEPGRSLGPGDLERARTLREALRDALEVNAHAPNPDGANRLDALSRAAADIRLRAVATVNGPRLEAAGTGIDASLGSILAVAVEAAADGAWTRLKVCRNDACRWAYWDASRNRSGTWCSMAICGNRAKLRTFRRRHATDPELPA